MTAFREFFFQLDTKKTGVITTEDLRDYMRKKNYKSSFVTRWIELFDPDCGGSISYQKYCEVLGLKQAKPAAATDSAELKLSIPKTVDEKSARKPSPDSVGHKEGEEEEEEKEEKEEEEKEEDTLTHLARSGKVQSLAPANESPIINARSIMAVENGIEDATPSENANRTILQTPLSLVDPINQTAAVPQSESVDLDDEQGTGNLDIFDWLNSAKSETMEIFDDIKKEEADPLKLDASFEDGGLIPLQTRPTAESGTVEGDSQTGKTEFANAPSRENQEKVTAKKGSNRGKQTPESSKSSRKPARKKNYSISKDGEEEGEGKEKKVGEIGKESRRNVKKSKVSSVKSSDSTERFHEPQDPSAEALRTKTAKSSVSKSRHSKKLLKPSRLDGTEANEPTKIEEVKLQRNLDDSMQILMRHPMMVIPSIPHNTNEELVAALKPAKPEPYQSEISAFAKKTRGDKKSLEVRDDEIGVEPQAENSKSKTKSVNSCEKD